MDFAGKLCEIEPVRLYGNTHVSVHVPLVLEILIDIVFKLFIHPFAVVHLLYKIYEECQLLTCIASQRLVHGLKLVQNVDEDSHHV